MRTQVSDFPWSPVILGLQLRSYWGSQGGDAMIEQTVVTADPDGPDNPISASAQQTQLFSHKD